MTSVLSAFGSQSRPFGFFSLPFESPSGFFLPVRYITNSTRPVDSEEARHGSSMERACCYFLTSHVARFRERSRGGMAGGDGADARERTTEEASSDLSASRRALRPRDCDHGKHSNSRRVGAELDKNVSGQAEMRKDLPGLLTDSKTADEPAKVRSRLRRCLLPLLRPQLVIFGSMTA